MKNLIRRNYRANTKRGVISKFTSPYDFLTKLFEEIGEALKENDGKHTDNLCEELADIYTVCTNAITHIGCNAHYEVKRVLTTSYLLSGTQRTLRVLDNMMQKTALLRENIHDNDMYCHYFAKIAKMALKEIEMLKHDPYKEVKKVVKKNEKRAKEKKFLDNNIEFDNAYNWRTMFLFRWVKLIGRIEGWMKRTQ